VKNRVLVCVSTAALVVCGFILVWAQTPSVFTVLTADSSLTDTAIPFVDSAGRLAEDSADLCWDSSGNGLGVGICAGDGTVHVHTATAGLAAEASVYADDLVVENSTDGGITILTPAANQAAIYFGDLVSNERGILLYDHADDSMRVYTSNAERLRIDTSGNVGIGTTAPDGRLHTYTGSAGSVTAYASGDELVVEGGGESGISILAPDANNAWLVFGAASSNLAAYIRSHYNNGTLQIGTQKVGGSIKFRSGNDVEVLVLDETGLATFRQDVYITDTTAPGNTGMCVDAAGASLIGRCTSLEKFKNNIQPLSLGIREILALAPSTFTWDERYGGDYDLGFIAENSESVSPLLVTYDEDGNLQGVKYRRLTAVLTKAMQEQQQMIQELEARVAALE
jgi:hypothetical protein